MDQIRESSTSVPSASKARAANAFVPSILNSSLLRKGLILILVPLVSQLIFVAIIWHMWSAAETAGTALLQRKILVGATTYFVLMAATLSFFFYDSIFCELKKFAHNIAKLAEGRTEDREPIKTEEFANVEKQFAELERALKLAVVAAHEGRQSRSAELKLQLNEERMRLIVRTMPVGLMVIDPRGNIESSNPAAHMMFSLEAEDLIGKPFAALFAIATTSGAAAFVADLSSSPPAKARELKGKRPDGTEFPVELTVQAFQAIEGNRYLALLLDVTQRHEVERLKQEFVAMVSHELRTPLTSVGAFLDMVSVGMFDNDIDSMKARGEVASRNVTRLVGLVNSLLDLEKMHSGRFEFRVSTVSADTVMERSIESVREFAEQHNVRLLKNDCPLRFDGDEERLIQVVINLLSNAIKFSNPGEEVRLAAHESGDYVEFSVEDAGPGIPAGYEQVIFEKYRQALQPGANRPKGTGLGLPLCKAIVDQHGGELAVSTKDRDKGSRFWFRIPKEVSQSLLQAKL